jgi:hypothetical protein
VEEQTTDKGRRPRLFHESGVYFGNEEAPPKLGVDGVRQHHGWSDFTSSPVSKVLSRPAEIAIAESGSHTIR